jgi:hypothetical protein
MLSSPIGDERKVPGNLMPGFRKGVRRHSGVSVGFRQDGGRTSDLIAFTDYRHPVESQGFDWENYWPGLSDWSAKGF